MASSHPSLMVSQRYRRLDRRARPRERALHAHSAHSPYLREQFYHDGVLRTKLRASSSPKLPQQSRRHAHNAQSLHSSERRHRKSYLHAELRCSTSPARVQSIFLKIRLGDLAFEGPLSPESTLFNTPVHFSCEAWDLYCIDTTVRKKRLSIFRPDKKVPRNTPPRP